MKEEGMVFGNNPSLVGVISRPEGKVSESSARPVLLLCNAGVVHHVGPNRMYVHLARQLVENGFTVVRFDLSGLGDSHTRTDNLLFRETSIIDTQQVMEYVTEMTGINRFCILGLSSGALISLKVSLADERIVGAAIVNPHGFVSSSDWRSHVETLSASRIYSDNLLKPHSWLKLVTGRTNYRRLVESAMYRLRSDKKRDIAQSADIDNIGIELEEFLAKDLSILLLFSSVDRSVDNLHELLGKGWDKRLGSHVHMSMIADANHTFANPVHQQQAISEITQWMISQWPPDSQENTQ